MDPSQQLFIEHLGPIEPIFVIDILLIAVALFGMGLNILLLCIACLRKTQRWAIDALFIVAIALFDFVVSMSVAVSLGVRFWLGEQVWDAQGAWCKFTAIGISGGTVITLGFTACLAVARYLALVRGKQLNTRAWLGGAVAVMSGLLGFTIERGLNGMSFVLPSGFYCTPQYYGDDLVTVCFGMYTGLVFISAVVLIPFCYIQISLHYSQVITTMRDIGHLAIRRRLRRNTAYLVIVLGGYSFSIFPEFLHIFISMVFKVTRTSLSDGIVMLLISCLTLINPTFALLLHDECRLEFMAVLRIVKRHSITIQLFK
ncbi:hypothetical protein DSO57_1037814 [Entomophthora muscae]|uniref:Uncharacterized protein n=1 Tax=Entomophthora muscae TaxID=34485 RepID=A0ACC2RPV0_9FUNG|nr:hypothetical protein DSO57_1037814 [Entomophthora muscae]